jgi:uncharacterized protein
MRKAAPRAVAEAGPCKRECIASIKFEISVIKQLRATYYKNFGSPAIDVGDKGFEAIMIPRWQLSHVERARKTRRVVMIEGARQCGKTTLAQQLKGDVDYRTLDDISMREAIANDLKSFLQTSAQMMIIDEVQRAPELFPEIKRIVDANTRPGQFLLTGSAHVPSLPHVRESLAGRIQRVRLRPFSQGEIGGAPPDFLDRLSRGKIKGKSPLVTKAEVLGRAFAGGYPEVQSLDARDRRRWHTDYITALLARDLQDVAEVRKPAQLLQLIEVVAAWSSKLIDVSAIGTGLSIQRPTLENYLSALRTLFLIEELPAWAKTDYARVGKRSKLFMTDAGLMASILRYPADANRLDADQTGKLFEVLVQTELQAIIDAGDGRFALNHYRDNEQREIDFLIEDDEGGLIGLEVKASQTVKGEDFKHLRWFHENLTGGRPFKGALLYTGGDLLSFGAGMMAVPIAWLWTD